MTPDERESRIADALADFLDRQALDETADLDAYCARHPDLAPDLREELGAAATIDDMLWQRDAPPAAPTLPDRLSGLKILRELGAGGMGRVYLAFDEGLGREVAVKTLNQRCAQIPVLRSRFLREARALAKLNHPNIVQIYNLGQSEEAPHFVMEYIEGAPLTQAARPLDMKQRAELMHKTVLAVDFLHQHKLIHRDLKPANILVGASREPKLLDLGLVLPAEDRGKLTLSGEIMGTPDYFAPEQARGGLPLDERSDVFSLGVILYEVLTGARPFRGETFRERVHSICDEDPALPRRLNPQAPGPLQDICLKALEKDPASRYASAREMADDIERYLAGEPVLAAPSVYPRLMSGTIEQHLRELEAWRRDHVLNADEFDAFRKAYGRLTEREDAWIMEVRRLSWPQVSLYLGAWILTMGAALIALFRYAGLTGAPAVACVVAAAAPALWIGIRGWKSGELRTSVAYLLAFCLILPLALLAGMHRWGLFTALTQNDETLEFFAQFPAMNRATNAQLWWAILLALPAYGWLRRFTKSSVFSLVLAVMGALLGMVTLLRMGMLRWLDQDPGRFYFHLLPIALVFLVCGLILERLQFPSDSRYFYPIAVVLTWLALSGVASEHEPYANWLKSVMPWTRGQIWYLFIVNAGIYLVLQAICERFSTPQLRVVAKAFRFIVPSHVLTSLLLLGIAASDIWHDPKIPNPAFRTETRIFELILPLAACCFVFGSIPKQMKNFFATGLLFLAIGVVRLEQDLFKDRFLWPIALLVLGLSLMMAATRYSRLRLALLKLFR